MAFNPNWENSLFPAPVSPEQHRTSGQQGQGQKWDWSLSPADRTVLIIYSRVSGSQCQDRRQVGGSWLSSCRLNVQVSWRKISWRKIGEQQKRRTEWQMLWPGLGLESHCLQWEEEMSCPLRASNEHSSGAGDCGKQVREEGKQLQIPTGLQTENLI